MCIIKFLVAIKIVNNCQRGRNWESCVLVLVWLLGGRSFETLDSNMNLHLFLLLIEVETISTEKRRKRERELLNLIGISQVTSE